MMSNCMCVYYMPTQCKHNIYLYQIRYPFRIKFKFYLRKIIYTLGIYCRVSALSVIINHFITIIV